MNHESGTVIPWWAWPVGLLVAAALAFGLMQLTVDAFGVTIAMAALAICAGAILAVRGVRQPLELALVVAAALPLERIIAAHVGSTAIRVSEVVGMLGVLIVAVRLLTRSARAARFPIGWLLAAYLMVAGVSALFAVDPSRSFQVVVFTAVTMSLAWFLVQAVRTTGDVKLLTRAIMIGVAVALVYGAYQFAGDFVGLPPAITGIVKGYSKIVLGFPRLQSFMIEPLYFANYLFLPLGLASALWLEKADGWRRGWSVVFILVLLLSIGLTVSRGAYLALIPFGLVLAIIHYRRVFTARVIGLSIALTMVIGVPAVTFLVTSQSKIAQSFVEHATLGDLRAGAGESSIGRLLAFQQAIDAWRTAPVLGIGPGHFGLYVHGYPNSGELTNFDIVNNEYLEVLAETGVVGAMIFMALLGVIIVRQLVALRRATDPFLVAVLGGTLAAFTALLVQYNFFSTLYIVYVWVLIGIMLAAQNVAFSDVRSTTYEVRKKR